VDGARLSKIRDVGDNVLPSNNFIEKQDYILNQSGYLFVIKSGSTFELPAMNLTSDPKKSSLGASVKDGLARTRRNRLAG